MAALGQQFPGKQVVAGALLPTGACPHTEGPSGITSITPSAIAPVPTIPFLGLYSYDHTVPPDSWYCPSRRSGPLLRQEEALEWDLDDKLTVSEDGLGSLREAGDDCSAALRPPVLPSWGQPTKTSIAAPLCHALSEPWLGQAGQSQCGHLRAWGLCGHLSLGCRSPKQLGGLRQPRSP